MSLKAKTPLTVSMDELAASAEKASRKAGKQARDAGIEVAGFDEPSLKNESVAKAPSKTHA
ncbi:MAG TPA: hypothetical protein VG387_18110 [Rhizomicrobium sp.]|jgi:hypothetical protein|nr:hypothetical protein [Rhizomicrobium sp.]